MKIYEIIIFGLWGIWRSHLPPVQSGRTGLSEEGVFPLRKIKNEIKVLKMKIKKR